MSSQIFFYTEMEII